MNLLSVLWASHRIKQSLHKYMQQQDFAALTPTHRPFDSQHAICWQLNIILCMSECSEIRKLDVGLHVSSVKVSQRQPAEQSQAANGHSPYSSKIADGKGVMKRKALVRSATFTAGSSESADIAHMREELTGRSSCRGMACISIIEQACSCLTYAAGTA